MWDRAVGKTHDLGRKRSEKLKEKPKRTDRFAIFNWLVDTQLATLNSAEAKVWVVLWRCERDGVCKVSQQRIGDLCGYDRRSVIRILKRLIDAGLIHQITTGNSLTGETNQYALARPT